MKQSCLGRQEFIDQHLNARSYVDVLYAPESNFVKDVLTQPFEELSNIFTSGTVTGNTLLDFSIGPTFHQALPACEVFKEITLTNMTQSGVEELEKWYNSDPGAIDWGTYMKNQSTHEGNGDEWEKKIKKLKEAVKQIVKCNLLESNPLAPLELAPFDCLTSVYCLGCICDDKESFVSCLRNMSSLLKPGGKLILMEGAGCTFFIDNKCKFPYMYMSAKFIREALKEAEFLTQKQVVIPRNFNHEFDLIDYEAIVISVAQKA